MAVLSNADRQRIRRGLARYWSRVWEETGSMTTADIKAAVDAADTWINANQASFKTALPLPFRTDATPAQQTLLFCAVALARVSIDFLKRIFGEVD